MELVASTSWVRELGILIAVTLLAYLPARSLAARLASRRPEERKLESRDDRVLRNAIEASVWPVLSMLLLTICTESWARLTSGFAYPPYRVMPILGFFLGYRLVSELVRELVPMGEQRRRLRRGVLPLFFVLAALQQLDLLGPLLQWMRGEMFSVGSVPVSLFSVMTAFTIIIGFSLGGRFVASILAGRFLTGFGVDRAVSDAAGSILRYLLVLVGLMVALDTLGVDLSTVQIALGALGVGIGFGLQNIVNDFFSGLILLFERSVKRGDILNASGIDGRVQSIGLRASVLRTRQGDDIIVPNSQLVNEQVTNYSFGDKLRRLDVDVGVSYESDPRQVQELLLMVASANDRVLKQPAPSVLLQEFGESSLNFQLRVWLHDAWVVPTVRSELLMETWYRFADLGINIPYPQRDLHIRSGSMQAEAEE